MLILNSCRTESKWLQNRDTYIKMLKRLCLENWNKTLNKFLALLKHTSYCHLLQSSELILYDEKGQISVLGKLCKLRYAQSVWNISNYDNRWCPKQMTVRWTGLLFYCLKSITSDIYLDFGCIHMTSFRLPAKDYVLRVKKKVFWFVFISSFENKQVLLTKM